MRRRRRGAGRVVPRRPGAAPLRRPHEGGGDGDGGARRGVGLRGPRAGVRAGRPRRGHEARGRGVRRDAHRPVGAGAGREPPGEAGTVLGQAGRGCRCAAGPVRCHRRGHGRGGAAACGMKG